MLPNDQFRLRFEKFNHLYDEFAPLFYGEIKRNLYQQDVCDCTLSMSFTKIWEALPLFNEANDRYYSWCYRIVCQEITKKKTDLALAEIFACRRVVEQSSTKYPEVFT